MKTTHWKVSVPGCFYAEDFHTRHPTNEREARAEYRERNNLARLQRFAFWPANPRWENKGMMRNYRETQAGLPAWASGPL